ncbi:branched-chain amino acid ABC transporter substrate-binding protein [Elstera litoralis]|uniref:Branched-chain amino acid ABC transporter substrate-binding protein n=1 Tax=Elstera litoralis TaxID=552518 RepID=A0A0F3ITT2_9PROT|nr:branched-chain amino acid ABC transporter substrate-binding protein [Elstera litoralis]
MRQSVAGFLGDIRGGGIRVGVLHALSGTMAGSERPLQDLLVMMIEQVNREGGLLGRPLEAAIVNPRSDWPLYGTLARKLLTEEKAAVLFGCWTSISRKEVLPVVEELGGLLLYPVQYEGEEQSPNIFYTGATPNQQALPAVDYLMSPEGGGFRRFYLIGTDYVYPQITNKILQGYLRSKGIGGADVALSFTPFGHADWAAQVAAIRRFAAAGRAAVISTVNGDANVYFYRELARQGVSATVTPVMAFSVGENEAASLGAGLLDGHLVAWNYLMSVEAPENRRFIAAWRNHTGDARAVTDDPMEATWIGFHLWCAAVRKAGTTDPKAVSAAMAGSRIMGPGGVEVMMDPENHHLHKPLAIGRITSDGGIATVLRSSHLLPPTPYSPYLTA